ncbi:MAG: tryptophan synthase subunit alpha, partial [Vulcanimicrobiaceae bacterium]
TNPVVQFGATRFAAAARSAGALGAIVPDVPLEELDEIRPAFHAEGLGIPLLIAPTTPLERATRIAAASDGFVYVVSRLGVTGAGRQPDFAATADHVRRLRTVTPKPLAVGFGIASPADVRAVEAFADGTIVGSALIDAYAGTHGTEAAQRIAAFLTYIRNT